MRSVRDNGFRWGQIIFSTILFSAMPVFVNVPRGFCAGVYTAGTGTAEDPYQIHNLDDLYEIRAHKEDWDKNFVLMADLDMGSRSYTRSILGWSIYEEFYQPFTGIFDGNGKKIYNLTIDLSDYGESATGIGFFGRLGESAVVKNLRLDNIKITGKESLRFGALAGESRGSISGCAANGHITTGANSYAVGGLVGICTAGEIFKCSANMIITSPESSSAVGGLVGQLGLERPQGEIGQNYAPPGPLERPSVTGCHATGSMIVGDNSYGLGGLIGVGGFCDVTDCTSNVYVTGGDFVSCVGGLVGRFEGVMVGCGSDSKVLAGADCEYIGGLAGSLNGWAEQCDSSGDVQSDARPKYMGGLAGKMSGVLAYSYSTSRITGANGSRYLGGLIGGQYGTVSDCFATGSIGYTNLTNLAYTGGLVGIQYADGYTVNCYSAVSFYQELSFDYFGGLAGYAEGTFAHCFWDIEVAGRDYRLLDIGGMNYMGFWRTTEQMRQMSTFTDDPARWDFVGESQNGLSDIWKMPINPGYPILWWMPEDFSFRYSGGIGTAEDPYRIASAEDIVDMGFTYRDWNKHFILLNDIDLEGYTFTSAVVAWNDPENSLPFLSFMGSFDGRGHKIFNLLIVPQTPDGIESHLGLFGMIGQGGVVRNVILENAKVQAIKDGSRLIGLVAGSNQNGLIDHCRVTGKIEGGLNLRNCGAIAGINGGIISQCYCECNIQGGAGSNFIGGLVGNNTWELTDCIAYSELTGDFILGGAVGINNGSVNRCYAEGQITAHAISGGICGVNVGTASYSCARVEIIGTEILGGAAGDNAGIVSNCYSTGSIEGENILGGLAGTNSDRIHHCYSSCSINASEVAEFAGGLIGMNEEDAWLRRSFWDVEASGLENAIGNESINMTYVEGKTTVEMKQMDTYTKPPAAWDFVGETENGTNDMWRICEGMNYPGFVWQVPVGDIACPDGVSIEDLLVLADNWLTDGMDYLQGDLTGDSIIKLNDLAVLSQNWQANIPIQQFEVPGPELAGCWKFNGDFTDSAGDYDGEGFGNPGFTEIPQPKEGSLALSLDGESMVRMPGYKGISGSKPRTCSAWIKIDSAPGTIIWWGKNDDPGSAWNMKVNVAGVLSVYVNDGYIYGSTPLVTGRWMHVAVVFPAGVDKNDYIKLYVNGIIEPTDQLTLKSQTIDTASEASFRVGGDNSGNYFAGLIDDTRIYDRALTAGQIYSLYMME